MRMADFIRTNLEPIIEQWEEFAKTILSASKMDKLALRDHAKEMLVLIADDLDTPQTKREQADKSKGLDGPVAEAKPFSCTAMAGLRPGSISRKPSRNSVPCAQA